MRLKLSGTHLRHTLWGALFGCLFPIVATIIDIQMRGLPFTMDSVLLVQRATPLHWIIDLAPVVLAGMGLLVGQRQAQLEAVNAELAARVDQRTVELAQANETLAARAGQLELIIEITRSLSAILTLDDLVASVVTTIARYLHYYHVHIYLVDEAAEVLRVGGGTGEAGQTMLARGHAIPFGKGLVGQAAASRLPVLARDVHEEANWLPNVLLPDTVAETAVPIVRGERVLGVLDVQHSEHGVLDESDVATLEAIADHLGVALDNASLYAEVARRAEREQRLNEITRRIQSTTSMDDALKVAIRELGRVLPGVQTGVRLTGAKSNGAAHASQADEVAQ
jgi:GAF domain-containing protein